MTSHSLTLGFIWSAVVRFRWRAGGFLLLALTLAVLGIMAAQRKYASEAKLFLRVGRESVSLDPTVTTGQMIAIQESRQGEVNSALELLQSRGLREKVVDRLGPEFFLDPPTSAGAAAANPKKASALSGAWSATMEWLAQVRLRDPVDRRERAVAKLGQSLKAWVPRTTNVIAVYCEADTPELAQTAVQAVVDVFREEHLRANRTDGSLEFFVEQANSIKQELDRRSNELREKKSQFGLLSIAGQRLNLEQQQGAVQQELMTVAGQHAAAQAKLASLAATMSELPETEVLQQVEGLPNTAADNMRQRLYDLEITEKELANKLTDEHPMLIAVRRQLAEAREVFDEQAPSRVQVTTARNPTHQPVELAMLIEQAEAKAWDARLKNVQAERERLARKIEELNTQEVEILRLERDLALLEADYRSYSERREQSRIDGILADDRISNVNVVQAATLVRKPVSPKKLLSLLAGLVAGVVGGVALAFLSACRDPSLSSAEPLEATLDLPVLLTVPRMRRASPAVESQS